MSIDDMTIAQLFETLFWQAYDGKTGNPLDTPLSLY